MNFFHNKISNPLGNGPTFNEWLESMLTKEAEKSRCAKPEEEGAHGQVINTEGEPDMTNDPHKCSDTQAEKKAENDQKVVEAKCGKEMGESSDAGKVTDKHTEAGPGNDENPEPKVLINNDPNYQKGESVDPSKVTGKNKKKAGSKYNFKKVASLDHKEKLGLFAYLSSQKHNPIEYVEAAVGIKFANMTPEEKAWFVDFWGVLYPEDYVKEMVKDR